MNTLEKKLLLLLKKITWKSEMKQTAATENCLVNKRMEEMAGYIVNVMDKNPDIFKEDFVQIRLDDIVKAPEDLIMLEDYIQTKKPGVEIMHDLEENKSVDYAISLKDVEKILGKKKI